MSRRDEFHAARLFHTTPYDLTGQTHVLPPNNTGREPNWDHDDGDTVFMTDTLDAAHGWAEYLHDNGSYRIYEVEPEEKIEGPHAHGTASARRARIVRQVYPDGP